MPNPKPGERWEGDACTLMDGTLVAVVDNEPVPEIRLLWFEEVPEDPEHKGGWWVVANGG